MFFSEQRTVVSNLYFLFINLIQRQCIDWHPLDISVLFQLAVSVARSMETRAVKHSLISKVVGPIVAAILIGATAAGSVVWQQVETGAEKAHTVATDALNEAHTAAREQLHAALREKAAVVGQLLAKTSVDFLVSYDFVLLGDLKGNAEQDQDIAYVGFLKQDGSAYIPYDRIPNAEEVRADIVSGNRVIGTVVVGIDAARLDTAVAAANESAKAAHYALEKESSGQLRQVLASVLAVQIGTGIFLALMAFWTVKHGVVRPLHRVIEMMRQLALGSGDLRVRIPGDSAHDEIGDLARAMNAFMGHLQKMVGEIREATTMVTNQSRLVKDEGESISNATAEQAARSAQAAAAVHEMKVTLADVAKNTQEAATSSHRGMERVQEGATATEVAATRANVAEQESATTVARLQKLEVATQEITGIVTVINDITNQTSLLALNASIEAARAGERGRGFALVADEVRALALRTRQSTNEIESMISSLLEHTASAIASARKSVEVAQANASDARLASGKLSDIAAEVEIVAERNMQIAAAAEEQTAAATEIESNITVMDQMAERSRTSAGRALATAKALEASAESLRDMVGRFVV